MVKLQQWFNFSPSNPMHSHCAVLKSSNNAPATCHEVSRSNPGSHLCVHSLLDPYFNRSPSLISPCLQRKIVALYCLAFYQCSVYDYFVIDFIPISILSDYGSTYASSWFNWSIKCWNKVLSSCAGNSFDTMFCEMLNQSCNSPFEYFSYLFTL